MRVFMQNPGPPGGLCDPADLKLRSLFVATVRHGNLSGAQSLHAGGRFDASFLLKEAIELWFGRTQAPTARWLVNEVARSSPDELAPPSFGADWRIFIEWWASGAAEYPAK